MIDSSVETFEFMIGEATYTAEKDMTWGQWVLSDYNTKCNNTRYIDRQLIYVFVGDTIYEVVSCCFTPGCVLSSGWWMSGNDPISWTCLECGASNLNYELNYVGFLESFVEINGPDYTIVE